MPDLKIGSRVAVLRDIHRVPVGASNHVLYATEGETGVVIDKFLAYKSPSEKVWYAKVKIGDLIKTFRLTSLKETQGYINAKN